MPTKQLLTGAHGTALVNSATRYFSVFNGQQTVAPTTSVFPAETSSHISCAGVISNLKISTTAAPGAGKSWAFTLYKNGAPTDIVVTIADAAVSGQDTVHSVEVSAGDYFCLECVPSGAPTTSYASWAAEFVPTTDGEFVFGGDCANGLTGNNVYGFLGSNTLTATESQAAIVIPCAGTIKKLLLRTQSNPGASYATLTARKNGSSQSLAATVTGATNINIDASNSFSVAAGDVLSFLFTTNLAFTRIAYSFVFVPDNASHIPYLSTSCSSQDAAGIEGIEGRISESPNTAIPLTFAQTVVAIYVLLATAPGAGKTRTETFTVNGSASELSITISGTNLSGNDTGSVALEIGDLLTIVHSSSGSPSGSYLSVGLLAQSSEQSHQDDGTPAGGIVFGGEVVEVATLNGTDGISSGGVVLGGPSSAETEPHEVHQVDGASVGGIVFGGAVAEQWQAEPNNFVAVKGGTYRISGTIYTLAETLSYPGLGSIAAIVNCEAPPSVAGDFRYDLLSIDTAGIITVTAGVESSSPVMPATPDNEVRLNHVLRYYGQVSIVQADIGKLWTAPAFTTIEIALSDDELAWAELTCTLTATCRDQYGQLYTGSKSINAAFISGNGTISPLVRSGTASSFTFTYTRDQEATDVSPLIELRSPAGPFATVFIKLLNSDGDLMV